MATPRSHRIIRSSIVALVMILIGAAMGFCQEPAASNQAAESTESAATSNVVVGVIQASTRIAETPAEVSEATSSAQTVTSMKPAVVDPNAKSTEAKAKPYQPMTGFTEDLRAAITDSKKTDRPIMLVFTGADWCIYCKNLEDEVFNTPEFENWNEVVKVTVNFPQAYSLPKHVAKQNELLKKKFKSLITSYPTVLIVDAKGSVIAKTGYAKGGAKNWITSTCHLLPADELRMERKKTMVAERSKKNK